MGKGDHLEELLRQDPAAVAERGRSRFERLAALRSRFGTGEPGALAPGSPDPRADARGSPSVLKRLLGAGLVLFGAGPLGRRTLDRLRRLGIEPLALADNNPTLWHTEINGVEVIPPAEVAKQYGDRAVFVVAIYNGSAVRRQLCQLGCTRVAHFAWLYFECPEAFLPHCNLALPERTLCCAQDVREGLALWADAASRQEYVDQIRWRLAPDCECLANRLPPADTYFAPDLVTWRDDEVFVDCGAFDGDTIREFLRRREDRFAKIVALEPDPESFQRLERFTASLAAPVRERILLHRVAVASRPGVASFEATADVASAVRSTGGVAVQCARLDDLLADLRPTYVKMDVEGSEMDALAGAQEMLARHAPTLAISLYHKPEDLWQIPQFLQRLGIGYQLFLRRYAEDCWELVCYAVPPGRTA